MVLKFCRNIVYKYVGSQIGLLVTCAVLDNFTEKINVFRRLNSCSVKQNKFYIYEPYPNIRGISTRTYMSLSQECVTQTLVVISNSSVEMDHASPRCKLQAAAFLKNI